jgi:hypothetical protein
MSDLATEVAQELMGGIPVALGFECPLFVPLNEQPDALTRGRSCDGNRPWSAGAGSGALATGLVQVAWVLREIRNLAGTGHGSFCDWAEWRQAKGGLLLWEAFVSGTAKRQDHVGDAAAAVGAFSLLTDKHLDDAICREREVYSLVGAALLRTGWTQNVSALSRSCLVVRPRMP